MMIDAKTMTGADAEALVRTYVGAWNERDSRARISLLEDCWHEHGVYRDPTAMLVGRSALESHIAGVQERRPGAVIQTVGAVHAHHSAILFQWRVTVPGRTPGRISIDVCEVDSGRLAKVTGFFGSEVGPFGEVSSSVPESPQAQGR